MRITIDASSLSYPKRTGIGRCLESILPHLADLAGRDEIILVSGQPLVNKTAVSLVMDGRVTARTVNVPSLYAWQQTGMAWQLLRLNPDVHYAPDGLLPIGYQGRAAGVANDILWKRLPETLPAHIRAVFGLRQRASLRRLTVALTLSAFTRRELIRAYGPMAERVRPAPLCAVDHALFRPRRGEDAPAIKSFLDRHGLREGYLLCVGNLMPHKNLSVVLDALGRLARAGQAPRQLAVVGHGDAAALKSRLDPAVDSEQVKCLGYLSDEDLALAYRAASVFVFPSRYEGFGLPAIEAMASGTPVVYADAAALPEAAGDAGMPFDPDRPDALAAAVARVTAEPALAAYYRQRGLDRAAEFSWEGCAAAVHEALVEAAGRSTKLPKVTIVTPSYNQAVFLPDTLASVARQQGVTVEHIVLDGGSTDGTADLLKAHGEKLAFWRSAKDSGQTAALAEGFAMATGEVMGWLNSDDYLWDDEALLAVARTFAANPDADMVTGDTVLTNAAGNPVMIDMVRWPSGRQMGSTMAVPQQSTFFTRRAYLACGGIDPAFAYCMDFDLFQRLSRGRKIVRIPKVIAAFRLHEAAKTATWQDVFRREVDRCQYPSGRGLLRRLQVLAVTLEVRLGSMAAEVSALLSGRKLPTWVNARLEPMRWWARKKHGLSG